MKAQSCFVCCKSKVPVSVAKTKDRVSKYLQQKRVFMGPCLMIGIKGESLSYEEKKLIESENIGGVILFQRNCLSYQGVQSLCKELCLLKTSLPLWIAIDQEGGSVSRLKNISELIHWPKPSDWSSLFSLQEIEISSYVLHQELRNIGIHINFSPCLDVSIDTSKVLQGRTFSKNPMHISQITKKIIQGARRAGVLSCAKHFPGHGGVSEDSHLMMPIDERSLPQIMQDALAFRMAISNYVPSVMLAHILYSSLDSLYLGSCSFYVIQKLLKQEMGFSGLVFSDDLDMKAVRCPVQFAQDALSTGVHFLICSNRLDTVKKLLEVSKKNSQLQQVAEQRTREIEKIKKNYQPQFCQKPLVDDLNVNRWKSIIQQRLTSF